ncbi:GAF and ANTAR domain-containing protein [Arthrobacter agilis]|uniref:GAF and ANTAR domain-containing protein n=1 Tax=Arthrobacter agilis TaxID=37921 RepID=UPI00278216B7|nr:GAF and ANTAR domain-containing protein [Arthrobacter agilis]MDQ0734703.1 hypothetical protein [Arthrobacter agilis]
MTPSITPSSSSLNARAADSPMGPGSQQPHPEREDGPVAMAAILQNLVLDSADVEEFLTALATLAAERLSEPGREVLCGVTLLRPRTNGTVASSSETARRMDEIQYSFGEGPCLTAARTRTLVHVRDSRTDRRWSAYFKAISGYGVHSILAVPVPLEGEAACGLNLYALAPDSFDDEKMHVAEHFAREVSQCLRLAVRIAHLTDTGQNLTTAMRSRTTINLAAGIIMAQNRCSQDRAMTILKTASNARNTKLHDVAAKVIHSISPDAATTHFDQ